MTEEKKQKKILKKSINEEQFRQQTIVPENREKQEMISAQETKSLIKKFKEISGNKKKTSYQDIRKKVEESRAFEINKTEKKHVQEIVNLYLKKGNSKKHFGTELRKSPLKIKKAVAQELALKDGFIFLDLIATPRAFDFWRQQVGNEFMINVLLICIKINGVFRDKFANTFANKIFKLYPQLYKSQNGIHLLELASKYVEPKTTDWDISLRTSSPKGRIFKGKSPFAENPFQFYLYFLSGYKNPETLRNMIKNLIKRIPKKGLKFLTDPSFAKGNKHHVISGGLITENLKPGVDMPKRVLTPLSHDLVARNIFSQKEINQLIILARIEDKKQDFFQNPEKIIKEIGPQGFKRLVKIILKKSSPKQIKTLVKNLTAIPQKENNTQDSVNKLLQKIDEIGDILVTIIEVTKIPLDLKSISPLGNRWKNDLNIFGKLLPQGNPYLSYLKNKEKETKRDEFSSDKRKKYFLKKTIKNTPLREIASTKFLNFVNNIRTNKNLTENPTQDQRTKNMLKTMENTLTIKEITNMVVQEKGLNILKYFEDFQKNMGGRIFIEKIFETYIPEKISKHLEIKSPTKNLYQITQEINKKITQKFQQEIKDIEKYNLPEHTVQKGDTLSKIFGKNNTKILTALKESLNSNFIKTKLQIGDKIRIETGVLIFTRKDNKIIKISLFQKNGYFYSKTKKRISIFNNSILKEKNSIILDEILKGNHNQFSIQEYEKIFNKINWVPSSDGSHRYLEDNLKKVQHVMYDETNLQKALINILSKKAKQHPIVFTETINMGNLSWFQKIRVIALQNIPVGHEHVKSYFIETGMFNFPGSDEENKYPILNSEFQETFLLSKNELPFHNRHLVTILNQVAPEHRIYLLKRMSMFADHQSHKGGTSSIPPADLVDAIEKSSKYDKNAEFLSFIIQNHTEFKRTILYLFNHAAAFTGQDIQKASIQGKLKLKKLFTTFIQQTEPKILSKIFEKEGFLQKAQTLFDVETQKLIFQKILPEISLKTIGKNWQFFTKFDSNKVINFLYKNMNARSSIYFIPLMKHLLEKENISEIEIKFINSTLKKNLNQISKPQKVQSEKFLIENLESLAKINLKEKKKELDQIKKNDPKNKFPESPTWEQFIQNIQRVARNSGDTMLQNLEVFQNLKNKNILNDKDITSIFHWIENYNFDLSINKLKPLKKFIPKSFRSSFLQIIFEKSGSKIINYLPQIQEFLDNDEFSISSVLAIAKNNKQFLEKIIDKIPKKYLNKFLTNLFFYENYEYFLENLPLLHNQVEKKRWKKGILKWKIGFSIPRKNSKDERIPTKLMIQQWSIVKLYLRKPKYENDQIAEYRKKYLEVIKKDHSEEIFKAVIKSKDLPKGFIEEYLKSINNSQLPQKISLIFKYLKEIEGNLKPEILKEIIQTSLNQLKSAAGFQNRQDFVSLVGNIKILEKYTQDLDWIKRLKNKLYLEKYSGRNFFANYQKLKNEIPNKNFFLELLLKATEKSPIAASRKVSLFLLPIEQGGFYFAGSKKSLNIIKKILINIGKNKFKTLLQIYPKFKHLSNSSEIMIQSVSESNVDPSSIIYYLNISQLRKSLPPFLFNKLKSIVSKNNQKKNTYSPLLHSTEDFNWKNLSSDPALNSIKKIKNTWVQFMVPNIADTIADAKKLISRHIYFEYRGKNITINKKFVERIGKEIEKEKKAHENIPLFKGRHVILLYHEAKIKSVKKMIRAQQGKSGKVTALSTRTSSRKIAQIIQKSRRPITFIYGGHTRDFEFNRIAKGLKKYYFRNRKRLSFQKRQNLPIFALGSCYLPDKFRDNFISQIQKRNTSSPLPTLIIENEYGQYAYQESSKNSKTGSFFFDTLGVGNNKKTPATIGTFLKERKKRKIDEQGARMRGEYTLFLSKPGKTKRKKPTRYEITQNENNKHNFLSS